MYIDVILTIVIVAVIAFAGLFLYRAKKRGEHCVGCPHSKECSKRSCGSNGDE